MSESILAAHKLTHDIIKTTTSAPEKSVKSKEVTYVTLNDDSDDNDCLIVPETNTRIRMDNRKTLNDSVSTLMPPPSLPSKLDLQ